jgi:hypothetical protein
MIPSYRESLLPATYNCMRVSRKDSAVVLALNTINGKGSISDLLEIPLDLPLLP